jgi:hypothetical protein
MKKVLTIIILLSFVLPSASCRKGCSNPPKEGTTTGSGIPDDNAGCGSLIVLSQNTNLQHYTDKYTVSSAAVSGDYLKVNVSYGGATSHTFQLIWNDMAMTAITTLQLEHNANGDYAKALINETKCFNISALKTRDAHGSISFRLSGYSGSLVYSW